MHVLAGAQGLVAGGAALLLAAWSVRAALTVRGRHEMMLKMTSGYEESLWINKALPAGGTVLSFSRFQLFLRRLVRDRSLDPDGPGPQRPAGLSARRFEGDSLGDAEPVESVGRLFARNRRNSRGASLSP
jgi:hypothetical protein